jgi:hypothetical protein
MKNLSTSSWILVGLFLLAGVRARASDRDIKEAKLAESVADLSISSGIVDVIRSTNGEVVVYVGGRGSATASLTKISKVKARDHALRIAEAAANKAFAEFVKKNTQAVLDVKDEITDSTLSVDEMMKKMSQVTENKDLAANLKPEDRAEIMKAVIETIVKSIRNSSGVQSVSSLDVKTKADEIIRGATLFGSHSAEVGDEIVAVTVFKWSPSAAAFAAEAEGFNNQKAIAPGSKSVRNPNASSRPGETNKPFISHADDF